MCPSGWTWRNDLHGCERAATYRVETGTQVEDEIVRDPAVSQVPAIVIRRVGGAIRIHTTQLGYTQNVIGSIVRQVR